MLDAFFGVRFAAWRCVGSMFVIRTSTHTPTPRLTRLATYRRFLPLARSAHDSNTNAGPIALPSSTPHTTKTVARVLNETRLARES